MERYSYQPLGPEPYSIRLLRLLPGSGENEIRCGIFHYALRTERAFGLYEALSYVWGDADDTRRVLVRDQDDMEDRYLDVTINLFAALRRLRDPDLLRTL
jgi:hypothetical protein